LEVIPMITNLQDGGVDQKSSVRHPLRRAWISVALMPVAFFLGAILSETLYRLVGYEPMATVPLWFDIVGWLPVIAVVSGPCAGAIAYGSQATQPGDRRGRVPMVIGWVVAVGVLIMAVQAIATSTHI
jgi:hypothetical protein